MIDLSDDRAVSSALSYILALSIIMVLISILVSGGADVLSAKEKTVSQDQLQHTGEQLTDDISTADRAIQQGGTNSFTYTSSLPRQIGGEPYSVHITDAPPTEVYALELTDQDGQVSITVAVRTDTALQTPVTVPGGDLRIEYDDSANTLVIRDGN